jgi:hypothetical protein
MPRLRGFCEKKIGKKSDFDPQSFRFKTVNARVRVLVGCPRGRWKPRKQKCSTGTRAYAVFKRGRCKGRP